MTGQGLGFGPWCGGLGTQVEEVGGTSETQGWRQVACRILGHDRASIDHVRAWSKHQGFESGAGSQNLLHEGWEAG